jgi:DNA-binding NarL/FixJ family response regulator
MSEKKHRLAIADDHVLFRKTLIDYLSRDKNIDIVFDASDGAELITLLKRNSIDILLIDIFMPRISGNDALTIIRNEYPEIKVIVLTMSTDILLVNDLLDIGIHGYISKADDPEELFKAIHCASDNRIYRDKIFTEALYWGTQNNIKTNTRESRASFDQREKTIVQLLWEEKSNKEIADSLFLSVRSIEKIRQDLKEKLGVKTTVGLLKYALTKKIIPFTQSSILFNTTDARR